MKDQCAGYVLSETDGRMKGADFSQGGAENTYCSFSASYFVNHDGTLKTKTDTSACGCGSPVPEAADRARQARAYVVTDGKKLMPSYAYNLTAQSGDALYWR